MKYCNVIVFFDARVTGASVDFIWNDGEISIGRSYEADWRFGVPAARRGCVRAASEAAGLSLVLSPDAPQASFWRKHTQHPAWSRILSKDAFASHLRNQIDAVIKFLDGSNHRYFTTHYQIQQELLDSLCQCKVLDDSLSEHGFLPDDRGFISVPTYDNFSSSTGRMSVTQGPRILTLPKEMRKRLASRWRDGELVEIDFNALEARVLSWMAGNDPVSGDLYEWIGKNSELGSMPRSIIKEATLSAVYGMSKRNFALRFQDAPDALIAYDQVKRIMKISDLDRKISALPVFQNQFGRSLRQENSSISHYVQSSSVDIACHGFKWLVDQIDPASALPVFLIHDAIILDIKSGYLDELQKICNTGLFVSLIDQHLPVKMRRMKDE